MRDLVGERVADHREIGVGLERAEDVVDDLEAVGPLEVAALLDVGVLVDDAAPPAGAKSPAAHGSRLSAMYFSSRSSPAPPAGSAVADGVPHVAIARASEVS